MITRKFAGLLMVSSFGFTLGALSAPANAAPEHTPASKAPVAPLFSTAEPTVAKIGSPETPLSKKLSGPVLLAQTDVAPPTPGSTGPAGAPGAESVRPGTGATPGTPGTPPGGAPGGPPGGMPPGAPPIEMILGYADFMLAIDRPYEAEKIYKQIQANMPKMDPNDPKVAEMIKNMPKEQLEGMQKVMAAVEKGLRDVAWA